MDTEKEIIKKYNESENKKAFAIGYASAMFARYYLNDEKRFQQFLDVISEEHKNDLLKVLLINKPYNTILQKISDH